MTLLYALTIFASAFLLFLVQPIVAKQILPWFGRLWPRVGDVSRLLPDRAAARATPTPISRCAGISPRTQVKLHVRAAGQSVSSRCRSCRARSGSRTGTENPIWLILGLLGGTIGSAVLPAVDDEPAGAGMVCAPLPGRNPYRLFALSNLARRCWRSLGYPFLLEPWVATRMQAWGWSAGYALFVGLCARRPRSPAYRAQRRLAGVRRRAARVGRRDRTQAPPTLARQILWCALAATGSRAAARGDQSHHAERRGRAAAVDRAAVALSADLHPLLRRQRLVHARALPRDAGRGARRDGVDARRPRAHARARAFSSACSASALFLACMFCHGELVRSKPAPRVSDALLPDDLARRRHGPRRRGHRRAARAARRFRACAARSSLCALLLLWQARREPLVYPRARPCSSSRRSAAASGASSSSTIRRSSRRAISTACCACRKRGDSDGEHRRTLIHGTIMHGKQYLHAGSQAASRRATTRPAPASGALIESMHPRKDPIKVGIIGLGTGTHRRLWQQGRCLPLLRHQSGRHRHRASATSPISRTATPRSRLPLGDARLTLEREAPQNFDVLAIDAFSSDAIPVHLITPGSGRGVPAST